MESRALQTIEAREIVAPLRPEDLGRHVQTVQQVMHSVMKQNVHFGRLPGASKDCLYRAGAEILRLTFHCDLKQQTEELRDGEDVGFRVKSWLFNPVDGSQVEGEGECWTNEEKFAWREAICREEFDETPDYRKRTKYKKGAAQGEFYTVHQIRTHPADLRNAVLKRAGTRSFREVILRGLACSDIFDQQLEEDDAPPPGEKKPPALKQMPQPGARLDGLFRSATPGDPRAKKPGRVIIATGLGEWALGFWGTPEALAAEKDWAKLVDKPCLFSFEAKESQGKVYRNLTALQFVTPAQEKEGGDLSGADRVAEEERAAMQEGA